MQGEGNAGTRVPIVDGLRGFAISGIFLVHMEELFGACWEMPHMHSAVQATVFALLSGKTFSIMALCFGFSFDAIKRTMRVGGTDFAYRYAWRLLILFGIGLMHGLLYAGDILTVLAVIGLSLLAADRIVSPSRLLLVALCCLMQPLLLVRIGAALAHIPLPEDHIVFGQALALHGSLTQLVEANLLTALWRKWQFMLLSGRLFELAGWMILGLVAARARLFETAATWRATHHYVLAGALLTTVALYLAWGMIALPGATTPPLVRDARLLIACLFNTSATVVLVLSFVIVWETRLQAILRRLVPVGKMALTFYILQSAIFVPLIYGFGSGLYVRIDEVDAAICALVVVIAQTAGAALWLRHFRYGPLEWAWRAAAALDGTLPMRRRSRLPVIGDWNRTSIM
jgi:uncharacterized protein